MGYTGTKPAGLRSCGGTRGRGITHFQSCENTRCFFHIQRGTTHGAGRKASLSALLFHTVQQKSSVFALVFLNAVQQMTRILQRFFNAHLGCDTLKVRLVPKRIIRRHDDPLGISRWFENGLFFWCVSIVHRRRTTRRRRKKRRSQLGAFWGLPTRTLGGIGGLPGFSL